MDYATPGGLVRALDDITLSVARGETLAVVGPSGCGKSTLLGLLGALDVPTSARISIGDQEISAMPERERTALRRAAFGFVVQSDNLHPFLTVLENVALQLHTSRPTESRRDAGPGSVGYFVVSVSITGPHRGGATVESLQGDPGSPLSQTPPVSVAAIRVMVFVVGSASLGAEIAAARLIAPYFGASTIIWANTIATVLLALSVGYALGGRFADRRGDLRGLCLIMLAAAVMLALVPFVANPFLRLSADALGSLSVGGFLASLAAVLVLVAVPVMLLGMVAPYANRLALERLDDAGTVTGSLYAISTAGSLLGTFASALLLIPLIGTHRTFIAFALLLAVVAGASASSWQLWLVPVAIAALLSIQPPAVGASVSGARVIYSTETPYQYARVLEFRDGERWLQLNEGVAIHSLYRPGSYLTGGYWDDFLVLPLASRRVVPRRIAILGDAAGTVARAYGHYFPQTRVDAVEIDGELTAIGRRYFGLRGARLHLYTADARPWLAATTASYDAIFLDAYRQPYIPFYLLTREFFALARAHLKPGGTVIVNVGHIPGTDSLEKVVTATMRSVFPAVGRDPVTSTNSLVIGSGAALSAGRIVTAQTRLPSTLMGLAVSVRNRLGAPLKGGAVYTDDRAPVEWLTDLSILHYAISSRQDGIGRALP